MKVRIEYPNNPILKEIIQYFLFIEKKGSNKISQICFPNTNHCLSLMKNSRIVKQNESDYVVLPYQINSSYLTGIYKKPIRISSVIPYNELCINFNPLGLETIFGKKLSAIIFKQSPLDSCNYNLFNILYEIAFSNKSPKAIQNEMEILLISIMNDKITNYQNLNFNEIDSSMSIENISDNLCKSYRSTHRFFRDNINLSPKDFLKIKKIRSAMDLLLKNRNLTEISYDLNFSDQSHFIKTFKRYTNFTPSQFKKMALNVENTLIWNLDTQ